jgi:hypothetical protein
LLIKRNMLKWILIGTVIFCFSKALDYGVDNNLADQFMQVRLNTIG